MNMPIFYRPEMSAPTNSYSPSSDKPRIVVERWLKDGRVQPGDIKTFHPLDERAFLQAHDPDYVRAVFAGEKENGFGNTDTAVAKALRYTNGSMLAAAEHVLQNGGFACSPTSGFHHAGYSFGGGFCTFNGLMVAALWAEAQGAKVGILDCDAHYGNGTADIIKRASSKLVHRAFGAKFPCGERATGFLTWLSDAIEAMQDCDLVLYQAGADPYQHDPLGGQLSSKEMQVRDHLVFASLSNIAWNFAGGYTVDEDGSLTTLTHLHTNTLRAAQEVVCKH